MAEQTITVEEWLQELKRVSEVGGSKNDVFTVREIAELLGRPIPWTREQIRSGLRNGSMVLTKKTIVGISDCPISVPAYRIVGKKKKGISHGAVKQG